MKQPFSFEFFPPKTDKGRENLKPVYETLAKAGPEYFSVTYGAGGSTKDRTMDIVLELNDAGLTVAPHLSFGIDGEQEIERLLDIYKNKGINRLVALRGDIPESINRADYKYYAEDLIAFVRKKTGDHFHIEVACYPEVHPDSQSYETDLKFFKKKVERGANSAITQYFYNSDSYFYYVDACHKAGIDIPIVPGIMPITNFSGLVRFSDASGAEIPRWMRKRLEGYGDDIESIKAFGIETVTNLSQRLLDGGAPSLHFYSMNQCQASLEIIENLK
jgi:methylenetetrahydrofolate reductase (NADPH)